MARSKQIIKKKLPEPDPLYNNRILTKFINRVMKNGKKTVAQKQVYQALELLKAKGYDPIKTFENALNIVGPKMEVRPKRVGGASYQVPLEVRGDRRMTLAMRWVIAAANKRSNKDYKTFAAKLVAEIEDILNNRGEAIRKRDTVHRMAEANRAFAHFRW